MEDYIQERIEYLENKILQLQNKKDVSIDEICQLKSEVRKLKIDYYSISGIDDLAKIKEELNEIKLDYNNTAIRPHSDYSNAVVRLYSDYSNASTTKLPDTPINQIDAQNNITNTGKRHRITEINLGKVILTVISALLLIMAASSFALTFWSYIPDFCKSLLILFIGTVITIIGYRMYNKNKLYPYVALASTGSAISYIGIVSANVLFGSTNLTLTITLIILWSISNFWIYTRVNKQVVAIINCLGSTITVMLIVNTIDSMRQFNAGSFIVIALILVPIILANIPNFKSSIQNINTYNKIVYITAVFNLVGFNQCIGSNIYNGVSIVDTVIISIYTLLIVYSLYKLDTEFNEFGKSNNKYVSIIVKFIALHIILRHIHNSYDLHNVAYIVPALIIGFICISVAIIKRDKDYYGYVAIDILIQSGIIIKYMARDNYELFNITVIGLIVSIIVYLIASNLLISKDNILVQSIALLPVLILVACMCDSSDELKGMHTIYCSILAVIIINAFIMYNYWHRFVKDKHSTIITITQIVVDIIYVISVFRLDQESMQMMYIILYALFMQYIARNKLENTYNIWSDILITVISLIFIVDFSYCSYGQSAFITFISGLLLQGLVLYKAFKDKRKFMQVKSLIFSFLITYVLITYTIGAEIITGMLVAIIQCSIMLVIGFIMDIKFMRTTSLASLVISIIVLVFTVISSELSMGLVLALAASGAAVLMISIIYSKMENKLKAKQVDKDSISE